MAPMPAEHVRAARKVERVLEYLTRRRQIEQAHGARMAAIAIEQAWLLVAEAWYGPPCRPIQTATISAPSIPRADLRSKPWFKAKYAKPLRKVTANSEYTTPYPNAQGVMKWYEQHLECGHVIEQCYDVPGVPRPKRRRCPFCVTASLATVAPQVEAVQ